MKVNPFLAPLVTRFTMLFGTLAVIGCAAVSTVLESEDAGMSTAYGSGVRDDGAARDERSPDGLKTGLAPEEADFTCGTRAGGSAEPAMASCPASRAMPKLLYVPVELAVGDAQMVTLTDGTKAKIEFLMRDEQLQSYARY